MEELESSDDRRPRKKNHSNGNGEGEDSFTSLPDALLIEILCLLPIKTAAKTSVLSHRWRHLWTQHTRLGFVESFTTDTVNHILQQLTSPKIRSLRMHVRDSSCFSSVNSCFDHLRGRNVEEIKVIVARPEISICLPAWIFECRSLVVLELDRVFDFKLITIINLPNLKKLSLKLGDDSLKLMVAVFRSCPLLEHLSLGLELFENVHFVDISCPNLKFLHIRMWNPSRSKFVINAPKLFGFSVVDYVSSYCFVQNPTSLAKATIKLPDKEDTLVPEIVQGISRVSHLRLYDSDKVLRYLNCKEDQKSIFCNLTHLDTTLDDVCGWKDLLLSLRCFPKLKFLGVTIKGVNAVDNWNASTLETLPVHLSKLESVKLWKLVGNDSELKVLEYILSDAGVSERVVLDVRIDALVWKDSGFRTALSRLANSSYTCAIEFLVNYIDASSNAIEDRLLACQLLCFDDICDF